MLRLPTIRQPAGLNPDQPSWRALQLFFLYRLTLGGTLAFVFFTGQGPSLVGSGIPELFGPTIVVYLGFVISSGLLLLFRSPVAIQQVEYALFIDILAITLLMHASGGIASGLGLLIAISITAGSLLMAGRMALLFAALASLAILTEQVYAQLTSSFPTAYTQGGLLGITFFTVALLTHRLSRRLQESERLARQRGLDLANLAQLNEYIIQHMNTGVLAVDSGSVIRLMNENAWYLLGMPDARAGDPLEQACPELPRLIDDWRLDPNASPPVFRPHPRGNELKPGFTVLGKGADAGTLVFLEDSARITRQAQQMKLASLGRLTASIAHEIRNPLGAISHAGQLLAESPELKRGDRRLTEIIKGNSDRVNDIIETVLQLSRRERSRPELLSLAPWTGQFVDEFVESRMLDTALFSIKIEPGDLRIKADPRQLQQVLDNLCVNALKHAGTDDRALRLQLNGGLAPESPQPFLDLIDNGPGITPEVARQIFEPFFTTGSKGTGLGLYIAKELCEINQIDLEYIPMPSGGSCFRLNFHRWKRSEQ